MKEDAALQLRLTASKTAFRCGEDVPLELAFTSTSSDRYQINLATYDRSGRMSYEQFLLDPKEGTSDPLELYFNSAWGFLGGGLTGFKFLSTSPTSIHLDLNEWVRFDRPGTYRLTVISHRVADTHAASYPQGAGIEVKSNPIELQITDADPTWQEAELKQILGAVSSSGPSNGNANNDPRQAAWKALRYLGSKDAARELARHLRGEDGRVDWNCMFGLIGSPQREVGLDEMNKLLGDPDFPVSDVFLTTMSILPLDPKNPADLLRKQRDENRKALRKTLVAALSSKRGKALSTSLDTAMGGTGPTLPEELAARLLPQLIEVFPALSAEKQMEWLGFRWEQVKNAEWLPLLRTLAIHYEDFPELRVYPAYQSLQLGGLALSRWYELDPERARSAVITEITRPKPRYSAAVLGLLPDRTLPDEEHIIAGHLLAADNYEIASNLASLLFRYADRGVLPDVLKECERKKGNWEGDELYQLLAYLLKVDPETARPIVEREAAVRCPPERDCYYMILATLGGLQNSPILEAIALRTLSDPDPKAAIDAVNYLGKYGSASAEQALWNRYVAWSREWKGRGGEFRYVAAGQNPHLWDGNLGQGLARALANGTNWFSDDTKLHRIQALGVGPGIQGDIESSLQAWSRRPFTITYYGNLPPTFSLAQYNPLSLDELKKKLMQFPSGTEFVLSAPSPTPSLEVQKLREEILNFAAQHEIKLMCAP